MKELELPFKTKGMYYSISPESSYNPSKINKIWNIITDQTVLNGSLYYIVYFGELETELSDDKKYYVGINFALLHDDFNKLAKNYISNKKFNTDKYEDYFYDFEFNTDKIYFENEKYKCSGEINSTQLRLAVQTKATGTTFNKTFHYHSLY